MYDKHVSVTSSSIVNVKIDQVKQFYFNFPAFIIHECMKRRFKLWKNVDQVKQFYYNFPTFIIWKDDLSYEKILSQKNFLKTKWHVTYLFLI